MWIIRKYYQAKLYVKRQRKIYSWKLFFFRRAIDDYWKLKFGLLSLLIVSVIAYLLFWSGKNPSFKLGDADTWKNLGSELHGLIFDILLFGIVLVIFEKVREKKDQIKRYLEELNDFRGWDSSEAYQRNHGILRRLINESYFRIDMTDVFLKNQNILKPLNFEFSQFLRTNLDNTLINSAYMISASFREVSFKKTRFDISVFNSCTFTTSYFQGTMFWRCEFTNVAFHGVGLPDLGKPSVYFDDSIFRNCDFKYFNVYSITGFKNCSLENCEAFEFQKPRLELIGVTTGITYLPNPPNYELRDGNESSV